MLPVCKACLENGCNIIVRAAIQNARAKQARIYVDATKESGPQEHAADEAAASVATADASTPAATPVATSASKPKNRKRTSTKYECVYILLLSFLLLHVL